MQVVLNIEDSEPWFDSDGRARSPLEVFSLLTRDFWEIPLASLPLAAWEVGVLGVGDEAPEFCKPQEMQGDGGAALDVFALGYIAAEEANRALLPLWHETIVALAGGQRVRILANDCRAVIDESPVDFEAEFRREFVVDADAPRQHPRLSASAPGEQLARFVSRWWPSTLGFLGGVIFTPGTPVEVEAAIARDAKIRESDLRWISCIFQTIRSYDNAGLGIKSAPALKDHVAARLARAGWRPGEVMEID
jgi:hypothetical protein